MAASMHRAKPNTASSDTSLIEALRSPAAFAHAVDKIDLIETHISWVLLAGEFVYKIKKPVTLDFLDFHDLEQRKFFCEEELRLNRHWAPDIYLDVIPITRHNGQVQFGGSGTAIEYALRMRRFDQDKLLDRQLQLGLVKAADLSELGAHIADRHQAAPVVDASQRDRYLRLNMQFMRDNFTALEGFVRPALLTSIRDWSERKLQELEAQFGLRFDAGFVRACHGDLHLANLVRLDDRITAFDCIEFSADLRHIDVICDIAFLLMDLVLRRYHGLAAHFLNRYLERTGDYAGMSVFSLYFVYRCLVRAKVAAIRCQAHADPLDKARDRATVAQYADMARRQIAPREPILVITSGFSGSGKTWVSTEVLGALPAIRIRSDIERKRLFGLHELANSESGIAAGIYSAESSDKVYARMFSAARSILTAGHNVILDAAFLRRAERVAAVEIARSCNCVPVILTVSAPAETLRERILRRKEHASDASEAGLAVLEYQLANAEPVSDDEQAVVMSVNNVGVVDAAAIVAGMRKLIRD
jgi:hypothetical protein